MIMMHVHSTNIVNIANPQAALVGDFFETHEVSGGTYYALHKWHDKRDFMELCRNDVGNS